MGFWNRQQFDHEELEQLACQLRQVGKIRLPVKQQQFLKRQLFTALDRQKQNEVLLPHSLRVLASSIQEVGEKTSLSIVQRVQMKERIFSFIRKTSWLGLAFGPFRSSRFWKVAVSSAMLLFFVVTSVLIFPFQVPLTYAARSTFIDDLCGQVYVMRAGQLVAGVKDYALQEGDVLITKDNSSVTVRFFDDSVSRLDSNTQIEVRRLYSEPYNPVATQVELLLDNGHIWTRVLNLIDDNSRFTVSTQSAAAIVTNKAAFDLKTNLYDTTLSVFDNVVDFALNDNSVMESQPVLNGYQAQVTQVDGKDIAKITPLALELSGDRADAQWVASNLQKDQLNTAAVVQENQQNLVAKTGTASVLQPAVDQTDLNTPLNNPQLEQERQKFLNEYQRLLLGEGYLMRGQTDAGMSLVMEFQLSVKNTMADFPGYIAKDPLNANVLLSLMQGKIEGQRKDFATFLPNDALYPAKEVLENTELYFAGNDVDKAKMQLTQLEEKLLEVQDLIAASQFDAAKTVLDNYKNQIDNFVLKINGDSVAVLQNTLVSLFQQQIDQIKELTAVERSLLSGKSDLLKQVQALRREVLQKLMTSVEKANGFLPLGQIQSLRNFLMTYMDDGAYDQNFVRMLNNLLVRYGKNVFDPQKLPSELGVVTIVDEEDATPAVQDDSTGVSDQVTVTATQQQVLTQQGGSGGCQGSQECG